MKEKLIEWSRNADKVEKFSKVIDLILILLFVPIFLWDIGAKLFSEGVYDILFAVFAVLLAIGICVLIVKNILIAIRDMKKYNLSNIKLHYILLSNKDLIESIILCVAFIAAIILPVSARGIGIVVFLILDMVIPKSVAKHFREKIIM